MSIFDPSCIDVDDYLECLNIDNVSRATEDEMRFSCPFPNHGSGDERPSCYMNVNTTVFYCHGCHEKGHAVHFAAKVLGISYLECVRFLRQRYSTAGIDPDARSMTEEIKKILDAEAPAQARNALLHDDLLEPFEVDWERAYDAYEAGAGVPCTDYMFERGFSPDALNYWEFGYDEKSDRIVFPIRDQNGHLVGIKGRAWDPERKPKYMILGDAPNRRTRYGFPCYQKSLVVFGLNEAVEHFQITHEEAPTELIVCEGELNAVALWQMGYHNAVAVSGSDFSPEQARLIRFFAEKAIVFFDSDDAGRDGEQAVADALRPYMPVDVVPEHDGDPASMSPSEVSATLDAATSYLRRELLRSQR